MESMAEEERTPAVGLDSDINSPAAWPIKS